MTNANLNLTTPCKLNKLQRDIKDGLEAVGLARLEIRIGGTPILDLPPGDLRNLGFRLANPMMDHSSRRRAAPRRKMEDAIREMSLHLGVLWARANSAMKYGKRTLAEVTGAELAAIHAAATAASLATAA